MRVLYEPKGRAKEYADGLAVNLYQGGCPHRCEYPCYVPSMLHKTWAEWQSQPCQPRAGVLEALDCDLLRYTNNHSGRPQVFLCFSCDPYPTGVDTSTTRRAIELVHEHGLGVRILTKGGMAAERDFDLLGKRDAFGVTFTLWDGAERWEPGAAPPWERLRSLRRAHEQGIPNWVSLEPVLEPAAALGLIRASCRWSIDEIKIGRWNYDARANAIDWRKFARDASELCERLGIRYTLKADLRRELED